MISLNLAIRKALWAGLAIISTLFFYHYYNTMNIYARLWPQYKETLFFTESWANIWLIVLIVSLIQMLREGRNGR